MTRWAAVFSLTWLLFPARAWPEANEQAFIQLWGQHTTQTNDNKAVIAACTDFVKQNPDDDLIPVARTLAAWHALRLGLNEQAEILLVPYTKGGGGTIQAGAANISRSWMTRLDIERVRKALKFYYKKNVGYPRTLTDLANFKPLPAELKPPFQDRFGMSWGYKLVGMMNKPALLDQKYEIISTKLGANSDLAAALNIPYAGRIDLKPLKVRTNPSGDDVVEMMRTKTPGSPTFLQGAGLTESGIYLAYVGKRLILVCDLDHWMALPRPI